MVDFEWLRLLGGGYQAGLLGQGGCLVGCFPGEVRFGAAEVAVGCGLPIDGAAEVEALDDSFWGQGEVSADKFGQLGFADFAGAEGFNADADRVSYADGVG